MNVGQYCRCGNDKGPRRVGPELQSDRFAAIGALSLANLVVGQCLLLPSAIMICKA